MKTIELTHGVTGHKAQVVATMIFSWFISETKAYTYIVSAGGGVVPVKESVEEITEKLRVALSAPEIKQEIK